jgi:arylsulfatase
MGPWKLHFLTREDYYDDLTAKTMPTIYNLRMDPFESYDDLSARGHMIQKVSWLFQPMNVLVAQHLQTLAEFPPVQAGSSFDMSTVVKDFLEKAVQ